MTIKEDCFCFERCSNMLENIANGDLKHRFELNCEQCTKYIPKSHIIKIPVLGQHKHLKKRNK